MERCCNILIFNNHLQTIVRSQNTLIFKDKDCRLHLTSIYLWVIIPSLYYSYFGSIFIKFPLNYFVRRKQKETNLKEERKREKGPCKEWKWRRGGKNKTGGAISRAHLAQHPEACKLFMNLYVTLFDDDGCHCPHFVGKEPEFQRKQVFIVSKWQTFFPPYPDGSMIRAPYFCGDGVERKIRRNPA